MKALYAFWQLVSRVPKHKVVLLFVLMLLAGVTDGIGLLLLIPLLDIFSGNAGQNALMDHFVAVFQSLGLPMSLEGLLVVFLSLVIFRSVVQYWREQLGTRLHHQLVDAIRLQCFTALLQVEWRWLANSRQSDHANLLLADVGRVGTGLNFGLSLSASLVSMLAYLSTAFILSWDMTVLALLSGGIVFGLLSGQRRNALNLGYGQTRASRSLQANIQESLAGIKLAKILANEQRHLDFFMQTTQALRQQQLSFSTGTSLSKALYHAGGAVLLAGYVYLGINVLHTPTPELLTLILIFSRLIPQFMSGQQQFHHCLHAIPALEETQRLLADCLQSAEPPIENGLADWPIAEALTLNQVSVRYSERTKPILNNVTLRFPARTTTAIIGASGAGKSTLADVLMGLLVPDTGDVAVDGRNITGSNRHAWRRHVAYVPQEVFLFHDSIRRNLLWGCPSASDEDLKCALMRSAAEFVFELPQGLDTMVGDGGIRLSGGERQRLALARALLNRPSLLILDEATSALDYDNEARIRKAIEQLHGDLTVVIIGHRLPTLEHADQVIVLNGGMVAAQGSWSEINVEKQSPYDIY